MRTYHGLEHYRAILEAIDPVTIERYDREESGGQCDGEECEQGGGAFTFSALTLDEQAKILHAIGEFLPMKTKRVNEGAGTSYAIKHAVERFTGNYTSNLQAKVALRILGYTRGNVRDLNPHYNISRREWRVFSEYSRIVEDRRNEAKKRIAQRDEQRACARYFHKMTS